VDVSKLALDRAAMRRRGCHNITFRHLDLLTDDLDGPFDLIS
jgi:hypothetical protein